MDLSFFGSDFAWYLFCWVSQKMSGPNLPVIYISEYTPWDLYIDDVKVSPDGRCLEVLL